jgi:hypothetical protein
MTTAAQHVFDREQERVASGKPAAPNHDPADCHVCGRHAQGVGLEPARKGQEPRWLCAECLLIVDRIRMVKRFDPYELKARVGGMNAGGALIEEYGPDLSDWTEEQVLIFVGAVWKGCADEMRRLIREGEAPF